MAGLGTFISVGKSLDQAVERVKRAEELGYDSTYVTHVAGRDSLAVLMAYAAETERIKLGTGVLPIYSRTPVATAQTAATIDELSDGRMVLGLGVSHQGTVENWYGTPLERPLKAMRE
jgi:alkanesulfonate monooxygenase SsuD/methylene tetrahydromethanopterin reductase-like flavin-dependent oxidoreductase (luciferase family)